MGYGNSRLDFGGDPDRDVDQEFLTEFSQLHDYRGNRKNFASNSINNDNAWGWG